MELIDISHKIEKMERSIMRNETEITIMKRDVAQTMERLEASVSRVSDELHKLRSTVYFLILIFSLTSENFIKLLPFLYKFLGM